MKNIYRSLLLAAVACLPLFTSCDDDNDSNPTISFPETFVLNTPEFAANNVYDLPAATSVNLTTNQPNYGGWPAAVTYAVQISLDDTEEKEWTELSTTYPSTKIDIKATELNAAILDLYRTAHDDADPEGEMPLYVRLRAFLADTGEHYGEVFSNEIMLNVLSYDTPSDVTLPTSVFVCGSTIGTAWNTWKPLAPVFGKEGRFYTLIYADQFKWGYKANDWFGYDLINEIDNQVEGLEITGADDGNIVFSQPGWYTIEFIIKIVGNDLVVKMVVGPGAAGVTGNAYDPDSWTSANMTAPATKDGDWTFSGFTATGELRAFIVVPGEDWWRTEFTLFEGNIFWRTVDIPQNWAENVGEEYSVEVGPGKTLKINFDNNTGTVE